MAVAATASRRYAGTQQGVVLLSVLLILALLSALIYQLVGQHGLVIAQARATFAGDQAMSYALGGESFARQLLYEDWSQSGQGIDTLQEGWAQPLTPFEVDNGFLEIQIRDLNSCFNLNSLLAGQGNGGNNPQESEEPNAVAPNGQQNPTQSNLQRFKTLLRNQNIPETLADVWLDWIDMDEEITGFGAEDGEYLLNEQPYRTANQPVTDVSELALLKDIEPEQVEVLSALTCVIPGTELKLNINTADAATLAALSPNLSEAQMSSLTGSTREYSTVAAVAAEYPDLGAAASALTVTSEYFEIRVRAQVDDSLVEMASVLHRNAENGTISLIMRDFGKTFRSQFTPADETAGASGVPG